jgi:hypothetical protein
MYLLIIYQYFYLALVDDPNYMIVPIEIYKLPFDISSHA